MLKKTIHSIPTYVGAGALALAALALAGSPAPADAGHRRPVITISSGGCAPHPGVVRYRRPIYRPVPVPVRYRACDPWYAYAPQASLYGVDSYFHAGLGIYFGGLALSIELGDYAPAGYAYVDPVCGGERWYSVREYRRHAKRHGHQPVLIAEAVDPYGRDDHRRHGKRHRGR